MSASPKSNPPPVPPTRSKSVRKVIEALESQPDGTPQIFERIGEQGKLGGPRRERERVLAMASKLIERGRETADNVYTVSTTDLSLTEVDRQKHYEQVKDLDFASDWTCIGREIER